MIFRLIKFIYKLFMIAFIDKAIVSSAMPAQSGDPISSALQQSLSTKKCKGNEDLDSRLCDKQILLSEIKYEPTKCFNTSLLSGLKSKYIVLNTVNPSCTKSDEVASTKDSVISEVSSKKLVPASKEPTTLPSPKRVLYSPDTVRLGWPVSAPVGSGFVNLGNTCYLNSSLQALFHVPAFVNWLLSDTNHSSKCESMNGMTHSECLICAMSKTLQSSQRCTGSVVKPVQIYSKLKLICRHLTHGHQEDAHEFLRYLIEGMERSYLTIFNGIKLDSYSKETTPLSQIFGGYLRSEVTCLECQHVSTTFQHFQDLLLDIRTASSVDDALESFFSRERLGDGDQAYRCEQCKRRVAATKKFTIERPPKALCIALKRFGAMGGKNSKTISMKQILDISKFRHRPSLEPCLYKLVSMVTHLGPSSSCGHYTAVGFTASGSYYLFDDNIVRPIQIQNVLNSNPYILMYEMETESKKQQSMAKKEVFSNGFVNTNGISTSGPESNPNTNSKSLSNNLNNNGASASTSSSELRPSQNGISLSTSNRNEQLKRLYIGRPRPENQPGTSFVTKPQSDELSSISQEKHESNNLSLQNNTSKQPHVQKETPSLNFDKPTVLSERGTTLKRFESIQSTSSKSQSKILSSKSHSSSYIRKSPPPSLPVKHDGTDSLSSEKTSPSRETSISRIPLPNSSPEKMSEKTEEKSQVNAEEQKSSHSLSLVPYVCDASSESEGELLPPKQSPNKEPSKANLKSCGRSSSPAVQNIKGVRIEIEGCESSSHQPPGHNRPDLHSPAGSTSSGKWSVTSTEKEKTPEKTFTSTIIIEPGDRISNGPHSNGVKNKWDGSRSSSTMDNLRTSFVSYGGLVKTWEGTRSELDLQVDNEKYCLKRKRDSYNEDFDRGKSKKMKHHKKDTYGNSQTSGNKFQTIQNMKNSYSQPKYPQYRNYTYTNRAKQRYNNNHLGHRESYYWH